MLIKIIRQLIQQESQTLKYGFIFLYCHSKSRIMGKVIGIIVAVLLLVLGGYFAYTQYTYSEGTRAGILLKFSTKGYVFKTHEGQLNLGGVSAQNNTIINNFWDFSVKDAEIAKDLRRHGRKEGSITL
jgi:hypothetical protein